MQTTNLGLIGLGYIGKVHIYNSLRLKNARLVGVADISRGALTKAKKMGVENTYDDYQELLRNSEIDAVIIALPTHLHAKCAKAAAEAHKHILLEKPLARSTSEGKEILSAARYNNVKIMIGHPLRFSLPYATLKKTIDSGELGEIQTAYAANINAGPFLHRAETGVPVPVPEWWWKKDLTGGGALLDLGSHMINLAHWYFGDVTDAKCSLGYRFNLEQEDFAICSLKFTGGQVVTVNVGWYSGQTQMQVDVHGTGGHAAAVNVTPSRTKTIMQLLLRKTPPYYLPFLEELQHFVDSINKDQQPEPSGEDGLKDLQVIEAAYSNSTRIA
jgi:myo-inositol 2-dehydrogenase / D-chiro-inositol 1-dehydrogenase